MVTNLSGLDKNTKPSPKESQNIFKTPQGDSNESEFFTQAVSDLVHAGCTPDEVRHFLIPDPRGYRVRYIGLDGQEETYLKSTGRKTAGVQYKRVPYDRLRLSPAAIKSKQQWYEVNGKNPDDVGKYESSKRAGTLELDPTRPCLTGLHIYFESQPSKVNPMYPNALYDVETLVVVEGEKKAFAGCANDVACIGLMGLHGAYTRDTIEVTEQGAVKGTPELHPDIVRAIEAMPHVKRIVYMHDADALHKVVDVEDSEKRKNSFCSSVLQTKKALRGLQAALKESTRKRLRLHYCHIDDGFNPLAKGLDDMLMFLEGIPTKRTFCDDIDNVTNQAGYLYWIDLEMTPDHEVRNHFGLMVGSDKRTYDYVLSGYDTADLPVIYSNEYKQGECPNPYDISWAIGEAVRHTEPYSYVSLTTKPSILAPYSYYLDEVMKADGLHRWERYNLVRAKQEGYRISYTKELAKFVVDFTCKGLWLGNSYHNIVQWLFLRQEDYVMDGFAQTMPEILETLGENVKWENGEVFRVSGDSWRKWQPVERCCVFNPDAMLLPHERSKLTKEFQAKYRAEMMRESLEAMKDVPLMIVADTLGVDQRTVTKYSEMNGIERNDQRKTDNRELITQWRQENPEGRQKDCQQDLSIGIATVKRYWKG